jgi:hypothetical protein
MRVSKTTPPVLSVKTKILGGVFLTKVLTDEKNVVSL